MNSLSVSQVVKLLKVLGDDNRFHLTKLLLEQDLCVGGAAQMLEISKPAASQHLKLMREAGLVVGEKRGYWTHYRVDREMLREAAEVLLQMSGAAAEEIETFLAGEKKNGEEANLSKHEEERRVLAVCKNCCHQPEKLKTTPQECTPEQVKECHGEEENHPCSEENQQEK